MNDDPTARLRTALESTAQQDDGQEGPVDGRLAGLSPAKRALLAKMLARRERDGREPREQPIEKRHPGGSVPLSYSQEILWILDRILTDDAIYNVMRALRLTGDLDLGALRRALDAIVARHEIFRTTYAEGDGAPVQIVNPPRPLELPVTDLCHLPPGEREAAAERLLEQGVRRGFDLSRDQMLRAEVIRLGPREHVLLVVMHHIATDGWSNRILLPQLAELYDACLDGRAPEAPADALQYADYAAWQREHLRGEALSEQIAYWKDQLRGAPELIDLPLDHPRPAVQSHRGLHEPILIPRPLLDALRALARSEGATLFMVLLAGLDVLLHRYSGQDDVVVGTPVAGRNRPELEGLIGFFANMLVMRTDCAGGPTFRELLARVRRTTLGAYDHQDLPFEKLVTELQPTRALSHSPIFQVMLVLQNQPRKHRQPRGLSITLVDVERGTSKFDLLISLSEEPEGLSGSIEYAADIFESATIARLRDHYLRLLEALAEDPGRSIDDLPLLRELERHQQLVEWNATAKPYPRDLCLHQLFEAQVDRTPDATAIVFERERLTYRELDRRANQLAHHLRGLGVGPEILVGLCVERSISLVIGVLGILKAGGAYVPLDPAYPAQRLAFTLEDSRASVLVASPSLLPSLPAHGARVVLLDGDEARFGGEREERPASGVGPNDLAYVLFTSGSTGRPKGVAIEHHSPVALVSWAEDVYGAEDYRGTLFSTSVCFDLSVFEMFVPLSLGGEVIVARDALELPSLPASSEVTLLNTVPSAMAELLRMDGVPPNVRTVNLAGEPLTHALAQQIYAVPTIRRLLNLYGPTEDTTYSTFAEGVRESGLAPPIGRPLANGVAYVLDAHLQPVPIGVAGELYLGGAGLARGYLNRPELTAARFVQDPFGERRLYKTGDLVRRLADGALEYVGRLDHQVKVRGFRIELGEIEAVLSQHRAVREVAVIAREDAPGDKRLVAYVVPGSATTDAGGDAPEAATHLRDLAKQRLPDYMIPSAFVVLEAMPRTPNGKLDRAALPAPDARVTTGGVEESRSPIEGALASIWAQVLELDGVGPEDDFFELGGHSLLATQALSRIRRVLGVELPVRAMFEAPTPAAMAKRVAEALGAGTVAAVPPPARVPRGGTVALSYGQERLWFLDQLTHGDTSYVVPLALRMVGSLDRAALERMVRELVRRHEALRTTYEVVDGRPVGVVHEDMDCPLAMTSVRAPLDAERVEMVRREVAAEVCRPFDLARGPLLRARLLELDEQEHVLLLTMHHIVSDGWTVGILQAEARALYDAFRDGKPSPLAEPAIQYADHAAWQRRWLAGELLDGQLAYWRERLAGAPPVLDLPTDRPRPAAASGRGARLRFALPEELSEAVAKLAQREGATLFMTLFAAFSVLLYRYTRQRDLVVGTPIANRTHAEMEGVVGFFVNTLALRLCVSEDEGFRALLARARETCLGAYANQDMPFERLVQELSPERARARTPLFQVMLVLQNAPRAAEIPSGTSPTRIDVDPGTAKFELTLALREGPQGIRGLVEYATDLFDASTIERMIEHFRALLEGIVRDPEAKPWELPLLQEEERRRVLVEWNATEAITPSAACLPDLLEAQVDRTPEAPAVRFEGRTLSYAELDARANQMAHRLRTLGVGPESLVGVCMARSLELCAAIHGVLKAGGAYVPLDPDYPEERLVLMLEDARPAVILTQDHLVETCSRVLARVGERPYPAPRVIALDASAERLDAEPSARPGRADLGPEHLAYVIFTSGSTGRPKGAMNEHRGIVNRLSWMQDAYGIGARDRVLQKTPFSFDVSVWELFWPLFTGATLVLARPGGQREPGYLADTIAAEGITTVHFVPSMLGAFLDELEGRGAPARAPCPSLRRVLCSGEALPAALAARFFALLPGVELHNLYGPTEAAVDVTAGRVLPGAEMVTLGRPVHNTRIYVLDDHLEPVPVGVPGELYIGGAQVGRGYLNRPELTAERFVRDRFVAGEQARMYKTGDLARWRASGEVEYLGRTDFQVKIRGFRIELGEIEAVLSTHPDVREAVVAARADTRGDPSLVAYFVPRGDASGATAPALRAFVREKLPEHMVPSAFVALEALPLTPSGKVDRKALPAPEHTVAAEAVSLPPRDPVEEKLAAIWSSVLGLPRVGVREGFFDLGGHSLLAIKLFDRIEKELGVKLPISALFDAQTIEDLGALLREGRQPGWSCLVPINTFGAELPFFCVHAVGGNVLNYRLLSRYLGRARPFYGLQSRGLSGDESPHDSVEEMAAAYVDAIRTVRPHGPYLLGGACTGGVIAYEMAQQLQAQGEEVAALVLLDTALVGLRPERIVDPRRLSPLHNLGVRVDHHLGQLLMRTPGAGAAYVVERARAKLRGEGGQLSGVMANATEAVRRVYERNRRAISAYVPRPYPGRACMVLTTGEPERTFYDKRLHWAELVQGGLVVRLTPGDHEHMLDEPSVAQVAAAVARYLEGSSPEPRNPRERVPANAQQVESTP